MLILVVIFMVVNFEEVNGALTSVNYVVPFYSFIDDTLYIHKSNTYCC